MSKDKNNEDNYTINLKIDKEYFKYESVKKSSIILKGHNELPQNFKFTEPKLSKNGLYISAIGKEKDEKKDDVVFIWKAKHINSSPVLKFYGTSKIEIFEFSPDEKIFVVIYKHKPPSFYDFAEAKVLAHGQNIKPDNKKLLSYSFSKKGDRFAVATDQDFILYNVQTGKIYIQIKSNARIKVYRGKILVLIDDFFNIQVFELIKWNEDSEKKVKDANIFFENRHKLIKKFQLTSIVEIESIITTKLSPDKKYIYFIAKDGIYRISIDNENIDQINISEDKIDQGEISDDCNLFMTTNMTTIKFWDFEYSLKNAGSVGYIHKEKFSSFSINFSQCKLLTSDDICIDISDIRKDKHQQDYIWLDLNPTQFTSFSFSPDYKVLLAIIDEHSAIAYNCSNGTVIKKWKNNLPNWSRACQMVPETSSIGAIATKSYDKIIKIWDYLTGIDLSTYEGFDVNNFSFSKNGTFLAAGTTEGDEIVRAWNLKDGTQYSFFFKDNLDEEEEVKNKNTLVIIHSENSGNDSSNKEDKIDNLRIIAVAEEQNPLIFNFKDQQLIMECTGCPIQLKYIIDVQSQDLYNLFYIYGRCVNNIPTAILFDLNGEMLGEFENCKNIEFSEVSKTLLNYSDDVKQNVLTIIHIDEHNNFNTIECERSEIKSKFLSDGKNIICIKDEDGKDGNRKTIFFNEVTNGETIGELEFKKKTKNFVELYLNLDKKTNCINFRYIELINRNKK